MRKKEYKNSFRDSHKVLHGHRARDARKAERYKRKEA